MIFIDADTIECVETILIRLSISYRRVINSPEVLGQVSIFITRGYRSVTMVTEDNGTYKLHSTVQLIKYFMEYVLLVISLSSYIPLAHYVNNY